MELTVKQVTKQFGRKRAVDRMNITLSPGVYILMMKSGKLLLRGSVEGVTDSMPNYQSAYADYASFLKEGGTVGLEINNAAS